eukprot:scaffold1843_cov161-Pinguiococcus_pyrenoidosus.AAC.2
MRFDFVDDEGLRFVLVDQVWQRRLHVLWMPNVRLQAVHVEDWVDSLPGRRDRQLVGDVSDALFDLEGAAVRSHKFRSCLSHRKLIGLEPHDVSGAVLGHLVTLVERVLHICSRSLETFGDCYVLVGELFDVVVDFQFLAVCELGCVEWSEELLLTSSVQLEGRDWDVSGDGCVQHILYHWQRSEPVLLGVEYSDALFDSPVCSLCAAVRGWSIAHAHARFDFQVRCQSPPKVRLESYVSVRHDLCRKSSVGNHVREERLRELFCASLLSDWEDVDSLAESVGDGGYAVEVFVRDKAENEVNGDAVPRSSRDRLCLEDLFLVRRFRFLAYAAVADHVAHVSV